MGGGLVADAFFHLHFVIASGHGLFKVEALYHVAFLISEEINIFPGFNALCNCAHTESACESYGLRYNLLAAVVRILSAEEFRIQLKHIKRHILQGIKRGITRSEIIHGNGEAILFEPVDSMDQCIFVIEESTLRKLYLYEMSRCTLSVNHIPYLFCKVRLYEVGP